MIYVLIAIPGAEHEDNQQPSLIIAAHNKVKLQTHLETLLQKEKLIQNACHELTNYCKVIHELPPTSYSMSRREWDKKKKELDEQFCLNMSEKQEELAKRIGVSRQAISSWRLPITYKIEEVETIE